jgi:hypothetical protein
VDHTSFVKRRSDVPRDFAISHAARATAVAALTGFAGNADAALTIDLRYADGGKLFFPQPGEPFTVEIWATVTGSSTDLPNSYGLSSVNGSIVTHGPTKVNIAGKKGDIAQYKGGQRTTAVTPFAKSGEQPGNELDLDGDGDVDLGAPNQNGAEGFFIARADPQEYFGSPTNTGIPTFNGVAWMIGRVEMTITSPGTPCAEAVFIPRRNATGQTAPEAALWYDDDGGLSAKNGLSGTLISGMPLMIGPCPDPATATGAACLAFGLLRRSKHPQRNQPS